MTYSKDAVLIFQNPQDAEENMQKVFEKNGLTWIVARAPNTFNAVENAITTCGRPFLWINMLGMRSVADLTEELWRQSILLYSWEVFSRALRTQKHMKFKQLRMQPLELLETTFSTLLLLNKTYKDLVIILSDVEVIEEWYPDLPDTWTQKIFDQDCVKFLFLTTPNSPSSRQAQIVASNPTAKEFYEESEDLDETEVQEGSEETWSTDTVPPRVLN